MTINELIREICDLAIAQDIPALTAELRERDNPIVWMLIAQQVGLTDQPDLVDIFRMAISPESPLRQYDLSLRTGADYVNDAPTELLNRRWVYREYRSQFVG